jgi:formylglycine-generating enzyme required for sulfatase activity
VSSRAGLRPHFQNLSGSGEIESAILLQMRTLRWIWMGVLLSSIALCAAADKPPASPKSNKPFENTLGMRFVPVPGTDLLFSIWDTRVQDYQEFVQSTSEEWPRPGFEQEPNHPAVNVSWADAQKFCEWLTERERAKGKIGPDQQYRLPTDAEWSVAVGLPAEIGSTPSEMSGKIKGVYPWGTQWPPPRGAGNYCDATYYRKYREQYKLKSDDTIKDYDDGYADTAPVGSYTANKFGLYDMGGNVWQWCADWYSDDRKNRVLRGASFGGVDPVRLLSSFRNKLTPNTRNYNQGFRCVLAGRFASR